MFIPSLASLSVFLVSISFFPYIYSILKGETKPVRVTWGLWSLIMLIGVFAHYGVGAEKSLAFVVADTLGVGIIFLLTFFKGEAGHTRLQTISLFFCIGAIALWQYFGSAKGGLYLSIIADLLAAIPTLEHAYRKPHEETPLSYMLTALGGVCAIVAEGRVSIHLLVFPLYITILNTTIAGIITRRRQISDGNEK
jgi:hypothetical protein